jgi:hypothetical protein
MSEAYYIPIRIQNPAPFANILLTHYAGSHTLTKEIKSVQIGSLTMLLAEVLSTLNAG